jgi:competence protein ComEC
MALQIAPLIVPERWILLSLYLFTAGIILFQLLPSILHSGEYLNWLLRGSLLVLITGLGAAVYARHFAGHNRGLFILVAFTVGCAVANLQFARHDQPRIKHSVTAGIQGTLIKIDGNDDARSRLWISLDATSNIVKSGILPAGGIVHVTTDNWQDQQYLGGAIAMRVRLNWPPDCVLHGMPDYGRRARVDDVLASGYVIAQNAIMPNDHAGTITHDLTMVLARYRAGFSAHLVDLMPKPAAAIAAALLVGERRFISEEVYNRFRNSGLAHLLTISGLHIRWRYLPPVLN